MNVPVNEPVVTDAAKRYVMDALNTGWISSAGEYLERFEREFASYIGMKHAVSTTNGTTALHLALAGIGIGEGDEVIVPDFTIVSCLNAVLYTGATPVFVDVDPETFTLNPDLLEASITEKTKAIMPVHIHGHRLRFQLLQQQDRDYRGGGHGAHQRRPSRAGDAPACESGALSRQALLA